MIRVVDGPASVVAGMLKAEAPSVICWRQAATPGAGEALVAAAVRGDLGPADARDHDENRPQVEVYGCAVSPSDRWPAGPDPAIYFDAAPAFRERLAQVPLDPARFFLEALGHLASRSAEVPELGGRRYGSCTVRHLPRGTALPPHCERIYDGIEVYRDLRAIGVDLAAQLSFFLVVGQPARGGELRLHPGPWQERMAVLGPPRAKARPDDPDPPRPTFEAPPPITITPKVGDLVVFPGGGIVHEIMPIENGDRWTVGGFAAFGPDGRLYAWG
ncbi:MAG: 2OG-Fe(II) oxygenase [Polyangiaceae bacterium]